MNAITDTYDSIIIGGGPAGATTATLLADYGHKTLVLERARFPRRHVGESLMPQTYWSFKRLGLLEKMKASSFVRKESVQFVAPTGHESAPFYFTERDPNEWSVTWQVRRDEFDTLMLENAREHGADIANSAHVREVLFDGDRAIGVRADIDGKQTTIHARVIVDATGQSALLARQLDARVPDERLRNASIYAHYRGGALDSGRNAGATTILHTPNRNGWFWYIPLRNEDGLVSVGVVGPPSVLCSGRGDDPAETLDEEIENCPAVRQRLANAERVGRVYTTADFSYRARRVAGNGWILVGDAFAFLDPIYSSGIMLALKSGEFAADTIHNALVDNDLSAGRLGSFGPRLVAGMQNIRRLVYAFYNKNFSIGRFAREHPQYKDHLVRILIGDIFNDEVAEVFSAMPDIMAPVNPIELKTEDIKVH